MSDLVGPGSHFTGHKPAGEGRATDAEERDRYIRAFNRLEKAVTDHIARDCIDSDGLAHAHQAVMRDLQERAR